MKVLNLYAGLGGNRKLWGDNLSVVAVEIDSSIASVYHDQFPDDSLVIGNAHEYLLHHAHEFDIIWSSPPCQSHSRMIRGGKNRKPRYPDLTLYEEILFLKYNFSGIWVVENVVPYYEPLIEYQKIGRHAIWSNYRFSNIFEPEKKSGFINTTNVAGSEQLKKWLGIEYDGNIYYDGNHDPCQVLRNCVHPEVGRQMMEQILNEPITDEGQRSLAL